MELADGDVSGDDDGTNATASTSRTYQATWMDLLPAIKTTATAMAARGSARRRDIDGDQNSAITGYAEVSPSQCDSSAPPGRTRDGRRWAGHGDGLRWRKSGEAARGVGAYRARLASNFGRDTMVEMHRS